MATTITAGFSKLSENLEITGLQSATASTRQKTVRGTSSPATFASPPGLGNAMGSLYKAKFNGMPMILTAGQQEQGHGLMEPLLYGPLV